MGNNAAFTAFEATVIAVYNRGVLDKELLCDLAEPYRGADIDRGGMQGTLAKDGLDINDILLKMFELVLPPKPVFEQDSKSWTNDQWATWEAWEDLRDSAVTSIEEHFGWE